jgi:hypothetical protein
VDSLLSPALSSFARGEGSRRDQRRGVPFGYPFPLPPGPTGEGSKGEGFSVLFLKHETELTETIESRVDLFCRSRDVQKPAKTCKIAETLQNE